MRVENSGQFNSMAMTPSRKLEQAFLEEMMKYVVPNTENNPFSGGIGEEQFSSLLNREYASALASRVNFGVEVQDGA